MNLRMVNADSYTCRKDSCKVVAPLEPIEGTASEGWRAVWGLLASTSDLFSRGDYKTIHHPQVLKEKQSGEKCLAATRERI